MSKIREIEGQENLLWIRAPDGTVIDEKEMKVDVSNINPADVNELIEQHNAHIKRTQNREWAKPEPPEEIPTGRDYHAYQMEYHSIKSTADLMRGDIIRNKSEENGDTYVVMEDNMLGGGVVAVRHIQITNPTEWEVWRGECQTD